MNKDRILFEISINSMFDNLNQKATKKNIIPKRSGIETFRFKKNSNNKEKKDSFLGGIFGSTYNIKNKLVCPIVFKSEDTVLTSSTKSCEVLLCKMKNEKFLFIPVLSITISKPGKDRNDMLNNLLDYCSEVFPYFYDVELKTCCKNTILKTRDEKFFMFPFSQGEWTGNPTKPRHPVSESVEELVWVDILKMLNDQDYAKQFLLADFTVDILGWFLGVFD